MTIVNKRSRRAIRNQKTLFRKPEIWRVEMFIRNMVCNGGVCVVNREYIFGFCGIGVNFLHVLKDSMSRYISFFLVNFPRYTRIATPSELTMKKYCWFKTKTLGIFFYINIKTVGDVFIIPTQLSNPAFEVLLLVGRHAICHKLYTDRISENIFTPKTRKSRKTPLHYKTA